MKSAYIGISAADIKNYKDKCRGFVKALSKMEDQNTSDFNNFILEELNLLRSTGYLSEIAELNLEFFYEDFLMKVVPVVINHYSQEQLHKFLLFIFEFVDYGIAHGNMRSFKLINYFIENRQLVERWDNFQPNEAGRFKKYFTGQTTKYPSAPAVCQFGENCSKGIDLGGLIVQHLGRRNFFPVIFHVIAGCSNFVECIEILNFLDKTCESIKKPFRNYAADYLTKLIPITGQRFENSTSLIYLRVLFRLYTDERPRLVAQTNYFAAVMKFAAIPSARTYALDELRFVCTGKAQSKQESDFVFGCLQKVLSQYKPGNDQPIVDAVNFLERSGALDKKAVYDMLAEKFDLISRMFTTFEPVIDYTRLFISVVAGEQTPAKADLAIKSLSRIDTADTPSIISILKSADRKIFTNVVETSKNEKLRPAFEGAVRQLISEGENIGDDQTELLAKIVQELGADNFDIEGLSSMALKNCKPDFILKLFDQYPCLKINDPKSFIIKAKDCADAYVFIEKHLMNTVLDNFDFMVDTFSPTPQLVKLVLAAFFATNNIKNRVLDGTKNLNHRCLIWRLFVICEQNPDLFVLADEVLRLIEQLIDYYPDETSQDLADMTTFKDGDEILKTLFRVTEHTSKLSPKPAVAKLHESPLALVILYAIKRKSTILKVAERIKDIVKEDADNLESAFLLDAVGQRVGCVNLMKKNRERLNEIANAEYPTRSITCAVRSIAMRMYAALKVVPSEEFIIESFKMSIEEGFIGLTGQCDQQLRDREIKLNDTEIIELFKHTPPSYKFRAPKMYSQVAHRFLMKFDTWGSYEAALNVADAGSLQQVVHHMARTDLGKTDSMVKAILAKLQEIIGECDPDILKFVLEEIPTNPVICKSLIEFYFTNKFPPFLRTAEVSRRVFRFFSNDVKSLLEFYQKRKLPNIAPVRTIVEKCPECLALAAVIQVLSSANFLLFQFVSHVSDTLAPLEKLLIDIAYGTKVSVSARSILKSGGFSADMPSAAVLTRVLQLLSIDNQFLFGVDIFEEETGQHYRRMQVTIDSIEFSQTFMNQFFDNDIINKHLMFETAPVYLFIGFTHNGTEEVEYFADHRIDYPTEVDLGEKIKSKGSGIYKLHAVVTRDESGHNAFIRESDNKGYIMVTNDSAKHVIDFPLKNIPELVIYMRKSIDVSQYDVWQYMDPSIRENISNEDIAAARAIFAPDLPWNIYKESREFHVLAVTFLEKYDVIGAVERLSSSSKFAQFFFEFALSRNIFERESFENNKQVYIRIANVFPEQDKLFGMLMGFASKNPKPYMNIMSIIVNLRVEPEAVIAFISLQMQKKMIEKVSEMMEYPRFVLSAFRENVKPNVRQQLKQMLEQPVIATRLLQIGDERLIPFLVPINPRIMGFLTKSSPPNFMLKLVSKQKEPLLIIEASPSIAHTTETAEFLRKLDLSDKFRKDLRWIPPLLNSPHKEVTSATSSYMKKLFTKAYADDSLVETIVQVALKSELIHTVMTCVQLLFDFMPAVENLNDLRKPLEVIIKKPEDAARWTKLATEMKDISDNKRKRLLNVIKAATPAEGEERK